MAKPETPSLTTLPSTPTKRAKRQPKPKEHLSIEELSRKEHLSIEELSRLIPYAVQTIRNLMSKGVFKLGVHYVKPLGTGRPIFKWSAVQAWLEGQR